MKRLLPSLLIVMSGLLTVAIWAESRSAAIYARADFASARNNLMVQASGSKGSGAPIFALRLDQGVTSVLTSFERTTDFAIGSLLLSFAAIVLIWLPKKPIPPNHSPQPAPGAAD